MPTSFAQTTVTLLVAGVVSSCGGAERTTSGESASAATHASVGHRAESSGPIVGDVTEGSALVWARVGGASSLRLRVEAIDAAGPPREVERVVSGDTDYAATFRVDGLEPDTSYRATVSPVELQLALDSMTAEFQTAPPPNRAASATMAFGGDISGQNVCRDRDQGYPIFDAIAGTAPDFFLVLGDMIYADYPCEGLGRYGNRQVPGPTASATDLEGFRARWRYNRADPRLARLFRQTPVVVTWDDHEVRNDFGPERDTLDGVNVMPLGLRALFEHNPLPTSAEGPPTLYRSLRWGAHLQLIVLDTRQYRAPNDRADGPGKTMLGTAQREWLHQVLEEPAATWTVVATSVPLSLPTGSETARDGWAGHGSGTGFSEELAELFRWLHRAERRNVLFVAADTHYAAGFRYRPLSDDPTWTVHEVVSSPLHAGVYNSPDFDPHFSAERLFYHAPSDPDGISDLDTALQFMNFGLVEIHESGRLRATVRGVDGREIARLDLEAR